MAEGHQDVLEAECRVSREAEPECYYTGIDLAWGDDATEKKTFHTDHQIHGSSGKVGDVVAEGKSFESNVRFLHDGETKENKLVDVDVTCSLILEEKSKVTEDGVKVYKVEFDKELNSGCSSFPELDRTQRMVELVLSELKEVFKKLAVIESKLAVRVEKMDIVLSELKEAHHILAVTEKQLEGFPNVEAGDGLSGTKRRHEDFARVLMMIMIIKCLKVCIACVGAAGLISILWLNEVEAEKTEEVLVLNDQKNVMDRAVTVRRVLPPVTPRLQNLWVNNRRTHFAEVKIPLPVQTLSLKKLGGAMKIKEVSEDRKKRKFVNAFVDPTEDPRSSLVGEGMKLRHTTSVHKPQCPADLESCPELRYTKHPRKKIEDGIPEVYVRICAAIDMIPSPATALFNGPEALSFVESKATSFIEPEVPTFEEPESPSFVEPEAPTFEEPEAPSFVEPKAPSFEEPEELSFEEPKATSFEEPKLSLFAEPEAPSFVEPEEQTFAGVFEEPDTGSFVELEAQSSGELEGEAPSCEVPKAPSFEEPTVLPLEPDETSFGEPEAPPLKEPDGTSCGEAKVWNESELSPNVEDDTTENVEAAILASHTDWFDEVFRSAQMSMIRLPPDDATQLFVKDWGAEFELFRPPNFSNPTAGITSDDDDFGNEYREWDNIWCSMFDRLNPSDHKNDDNDTTSIACDEEDFRNKYQEDIYCVPLDEYCQGLPEETFESAKNPAMRTMYAFKDADGTVSLNKIDDSGLEKSTGFVSSFLICCLSMFAFKQWRELQRQLINGLVTVLMFMAILEQVEVKKSEFDAVFQKFKQHDNVLKNLEVSFPLLKKNLGVFGARYVGPHGNSFLSCDRPGSLNDPLEENQQKKTSSEVNIKGAGVDFLRDVLHIPDYFKPEPTIIQAYPLTLQSNGTVFQSKNRKKNVPRTPDYNDELIRLASFSKCPPDVTFFRISLAKEGYYFSEEMQALVCHFCKSRIHSTQVDFMTKVPHFQECKIVDRKNLNARNIPIEFGIPDNYKALFEREVNALQLPELGAKISQLQQQSATALENLKMPDLPIQDITLEETQDDALEYRPNPEAPGAATPGTSENEIASSSDEASRAATLRYFVHSYDQEGKPISTAQTMDFMSDTRSNASMKSELNRMSTFLRWGKSEVIKPEELAKAGFYYTGTGDRVRCAFCNGVLRNWAVGDSAAVEHKRHYPTCPFVLKLDVGNEPRHPDLSTVRSSVEATTRDVPKATTLGNNTKGKLAQALKNLGAHSLASQGNAAQSTNTSAPPNTTNVSVPQIPGTILVPKHPNFSTTEARMITFEAWPTTNVQRPQELAECGFYYTGTGDNVRCFHCDGGLRNWLSTDLPWTEHARWFPRCGFLQRVKGAEFVIAEVNRHSQHNLTSALGIGNTGTIESMEIETRPQPSTSAPAITRRIEAREIRARFDTEQVQMVLSMGYPPAVVKCVILQKMKSTGDDFPNAASLLDAIFAEEATLNEHGLQYYEDILHSEFGSPTAIVQPQAGRTTGHNAPSGSKPPPTSASMTAKTSSLKVPQIEVSTEDPQSLMEENRQLKEQTTCKICMDKEVSVVFVPCGHLVCCTDCAPSLQNCPICRKRISNTIRTFMS